ncbi:MAG: GNAT family N-acetyltransferase [Granulosicoccus sp.]
MNIKFRPVVSEEFYFAFEVKKQAMGEHILAKWEWDEEFQLNLHRKRWHEKPWYVIDIDGTDVGTISLHDLDKNTLRLGEFYLLDEFRNSGLGTAFLNSVIEASDTKGKTVILEALKWNPVRTLYERHGFSVTSENEIHYFMERKSLR